MLPESVLKSPHCCVVSKSLFLGCLSSLGRAKARVQILDVASVRVDHVEMEMRMCLVDVLDHRAEVVTEFELQPFHCALLPVFVLDAIMWVGRYACQQNGCILSESTTGCVGTVRMDGADLDFKLG